MERSRNPVFVCHTNELEIGQMLRLVHDRRAIVVGRRGFRQYFALRDRCPHMGAPLSAGLLTGTTLPSRVGRYTYGRERGVIRCPWHGFEFDVVTGAEIYTSTRDGVRTYPVYVDDGAVFVDVAIVKQQIVGADQAAVGRS